MSTGSAHIYHTSEIVVQMGQMYTDTMFHYIINEKSSL